MFEIKKWEPMRELTAIQREMDDFFKRFFGTISPIGFLRTEVSGEWMPVIDCFFKENHFIVKADLPGIDPKNVDISITGKVLTIKGERKTARDEKKEDYLFHEATYGAFERSVTLPEGVDASKVRATYKNGVLELSMPAKAEALPKKITVEIEEGREGRKAA